MKKYLQLIAGAMLAVILAGSCGNSLSPGDTVKQYIYAIRDKDGDTALELSTKEREFSEAYFEQAGGLFKKIRKISILSEEISKNGKKAVVKYKVTYKGDKEDSASVNLVKEDNQWKVKWR